MLCSSTELTTISPVADTDTHGGGRPSLAKGLIIPGSHVCFRISHRSYGSVEKDTPLKDVDASSSDSALNVCSGLGLVAQNFWVN